MATFRIVYVFVAMEVGSRRILHWNVTDHPTAEWTIQQFREFLVFDHPYRFLIHDRDGIFSLVVDEALKGFGIRVLKTPVRAPKANAYCERLVGTIRRKCLDFLIPINQGHLKRILHEFIRHYNRGRHHSSLGPGIPEPPHAKVPAGLHRNTLPIGYRVTSKPVLGRLHHEYSLEKEAAWRRAEFLRSTPAIVGPIFPAEVSCRLRWVSGLMITDSGKPKTDLQPSEGHCLNFQLT